MGEGPPPAFFNTIDPKRPFGLARLSSVQVPAATGCGSPWGRETRQASGGKFCVSVSGSWPRA